MKHSKINLKKLIKALNLIPLYETKCEEVFVDSADISRPGLQLTGYYDYFVPHRAQLLGLAEITYMESQPESILRERLDYLFSQGVPLILTSRSLMPPNTFVEVARKYDIPVLLSGEHTMRIYHSALNYFDKELAPIIARHGGLMDVFGVGVYMTGDSGVGKSEAELELIKRGHRFIADDVVEIKRLMGERLVGRSPEVLRNLMELRGIGVIDVSVLYGMGLVMEEKDIELCVHLEPSDNNSDMFIENRLAGVNDHITLLGIDVPKITIPVRPGRNLAVIIEVAAMNHRLNTGGFEDSAKLNSRINELIGG